MARDCGLTANLNGRSCPDNFLKGVAFILYTKRGENTFATLSAMTKAAIVSAINYTNNALRIFPVDKIEEFKPEQADNKVQTFTSENVNFIRKSAMKTTFIKSDADAKTEAAFLSLNNGNFDAYYFDMYGAMMYRKPSDTTADQVQGIPIGTGSTSPKFAPSDGTTNVEHVMVSQNWDVKLDYTEIAYASKSELGFDISDIAEALITVDTPLFSGITTTVAVIDMFTDRGAAIEGLTVANMTSLTVAGTGKTISSLVESTTVAGRYTVTWTTAGTAGQTVVIVWTGNGYDWRHPNSTTFAIPA